MAFDPNAAASADSGLYGLPHTVEEAGDATHREELHP